MGILKGEFEMSNARSPNRDKSFEIYKEKNGKITLKEIASILSESINNIKSWKSQDKWNEKLNIKSSKRGAAKNNKNAVGNKGGKGGPKENINAFKHGNYIPNERFESKKFLAKYLPKATEKIMDDINNSGISPLDMLWFNIQLQFATLLRSQKIMHVKNHKDMTKELKKIKVQKDLVGPKGNQTLEETYREEEYEIQFAWDKQERFNTSQSKVMQVLLNMIKTYDEMLEKYKESATEEQKLRIEKLKQEIMLNDKKLKLGSLDEDIVIKVTLPGDFEDD